MQVPETKGKAHVSFRVTMMLTMTLTQVLAAAGTCSEHLGRMGSLCNSSLLSSTGCDDDSNPMRRVLSSSHSADDSKPRRRDSGGFPQAQGNVYLSAGLRLPLPLPLPALPPAALSSSENVLGEVGRESSVPREGGHHTLLDHGQ